MSSAETDSGQTIDNFGAVSPVPSAVNLTPATVARLSTILWYFAALTIPALLFTSMSAIRLIDGDEGFYLYAARLIGEGQKPYIDFFFPQMPLTPYVYAVWGYFFGLTWNSARLFGALVAVLTSALVFYHACSVTKRRDLGLLAVWLFSFASLSLTWLVTAKTYGLSTFFLFLAYTLLTLQTVRFERLRFLAVGLALGLAVDTRLYLASVVPVFILATIYFRKSSGSFHGMCLVLLGVLLATFPNLWFVAQGFDQFLFNNLGFHLSRTRLDPEWLLYNKIEVALRFLGGSLADGECEGFQTILLLVPSMAIVLNFRKVDPRCIFASILLLVLIAVSLAPSPTYFQYFVVTIPFLVINAVYCISFVDFRTTKNRYIFFTLFILFAAPIPNEMWRYSVSGKGLAGFENPGQWSIQSVRTTSRRIDTAAHGDSFGLSWWPGYFVESKTKISPGFENHFARLASRGRTIEQRRLYRLPTVSSLYYDGTSASTVVVGNWLTDFERIKFTKMLLELNCLREAPESSPSPAEIFRCNLPRSA